MFDKILDSISPYKYLIILGLISSVLGYIQYLRMDIASINNELTETKTTVTVRDERIKSLNGDILALEASLNIERDGYRISQESIAELKKLLSKKPTEKFIYVTEYIKNPDIPKCVVSDEWVLAYQRIRANPYTVVPGHKDR